MANFLDLTTGLPALWAKIKSKFYTKTEVDALIPEDEIFLVNITTSGTGKNITYVSDKTADEVYALVNSYKIIYGVEDSGNDYYIWHNGYFHNIGERIGLSGFYVKDLVFSTQISSYALSPVYTQLAEQDTLSNYLAKGNTTAYTPMADYNPATKKYVDDKVVYSTISINGTTATFSSPITPKYVYENYLNKRIYAKYGYEGRIYALSKCEEDDGDVQIIFSCVENGVLHTITSAWVSESSTSALTGTVASTSIPVASSTTPLMDGTATIGSSINYARADHAHPSDTSRVAVAQGVANAGKYLKVNSSGNVAVADLDTEVLVVTFTYDRYENNNYIYIADKSNTEITNAYSAGKIVMGKTQDGGGAYLFNGGGFFATQPDEDYPIISYFYYHGSDYEYSGDFISLIDSNRFYNSVLYKTNTDAYTPTADYHPATKKYVDDAVAAVDVPSEVVVVTITISTVDGETVYTADKTYSELREASIAGKNIILKHSIYTFYLWASPKTSSATTQFIFGTLVGGNEFYFTITSNNVVSRPTLQSVRSVNGNTGAVSLGISDMNDATISNPADGQVLQYDATNEVWVNATLPTGVTETRVNELIAAALAQYGDGDTATYGYTDASEVNY